MIYIHFPGPLRAAQGTGLHPASMGTVDIGMASYLQLYIHCGASDISTTGPVPFSAGEITSWTIWKDPFCIPFSPSAASCHDRPTLLVNRTLPNRFPSNFQAGISFNILSWLPVRIYSGSSSGLAMGICGQKNSLSSYSFSQTHPVEDDFLAQL